MEDLKKGIVSHISDRGFGFVKDPENLRDRKGIFFHASALQNYDFADLERGDEVEYTDIITTDRGTSALKVYVTKE